MYSITRQDAADILWVSTRSVDRYVKSWKLRSQKDGKIIYIHSEDIEKLSGKSSEKKQEIITPKNHSYTERKSREFFENQSETRVQKATETPAALEKIYHDLRSEIKIKDQAIQDLSLKLGQAQEIAKNSVSIVEFKKSQFLLEESKWHLSGELSELKREKEALGQKLKYEKSTNYLLIWFCIILLLGLPPPKG